VPFQEILLHSFKGKYNIKRQLALNKGKNLSLVYLGLNKLIQELI